MIRRDDLLEEIQKCQIDPVTYASIGRLSDLFTVYDHLFKDEEMNDTKDIVYSSSSYGELNRTVDEEIVHVYGDSDFMNLIKGKNAYEMWRIMDELMSTLRVIQPKLYDSVMDRIEM